MDGLAMAMWALWNSSCFSICVQKAVNLLGDSDTVGAIAGQMAGALYGYGGILKDDWSKTCVSNLRYWDRNAEIGLRAALLYHHGPSPDVQLRQSENFPTVRVFRAPRPGEEVVGEVPTGDFVKCLRASGDFFEIFHAETGIKGWVGRKNLYSWAVAVGTEDLKSYNSLGEREEIARFRDEGGDIHEPPPVPPPADNMPKPPPLRLPAI